MSNFFIVIVFLGANGLYSQIFLHYKNTGFPERIGTLSFWYSSFNLKYIWIYVSIFRRLYLDCKFQNLVSTTSVPLLHFHLDLEQIHIMRFRSHLQHHHYCLPESQTMHNTEVING